MKTVLPQASLRRICSVLAVSRSALQDRNGGRREPVVDELLAGPGAMAPPAAGPSPPFRLGNLLPLAPDGTLDFHNLALKDITRTVQEKVEREVIAYVLEKTGYNRSKASRLLKISYKALLYKIRDLNIHIPSKSLD